VRTSFICVGPKWFDSWVSLGPGSLPEDPIVPSVSIGSGSSEYARRSKGGMKINIPHCLANYDSDSKLDHLPDAASKSLGQLYMTSRVDGILYTSVLVAADISITLLLRQRPTLYAVLTLFRT
jgi:hypothetical protein